MSKLYKIPNLSNQEILGLITQFFVNFNEHEEYCKDEATNLLNLYYEYFMRKENIDTIKINTTLHFSKLSKDDGYAYLLWDVKHNYEVYLDKKHASGRKTDAFLYEKLVYLIIDAGHEFQHIVQHETKSRKYNKDFDKNVRRTEYNYRSNVNSINKKHLRHALNKHLENLNIIHCSEIDADEISTKISLMLVEDIINNSGNLDTNFIDFMNAIKVLIIEEHFARKNGYKECEKNEEHAKRYLKTMDVTLTI